MEKVFDCSEERPVYTRLHLAVLSNDLDKINCLVNDGADANEKTYAKDKWSLKIQCECTNLMFCFHEADEYGNEWKDGDVVEQNALHLAAKHGHVEIVKFLLNVIKDVNEPSGDGSTALHYAMHNFDIEVTRLLLEHGADIDAQNSDGKTPLYLAVKFERIDLVKYLLSNNAKVNILSRNKSSPLYSALINCNQELVQVLLDNKALTDVRNKYCEDPLLFLIRVIEKGESRLCFVRQLLDNGFDLKKYDQERYSSPLYSAVQNKDEALASLLINRGCNVNHTIRDRFNLTFLSFAVCTNMVSLVRLLLTHGAFVNQFINKSSLLEYAVVRRNAKLVQLLLEFNADIEAGSESNAPLFNAIQHRHTNILEMLIDKGADINYKGNKGRTPLMRAVMIKNEPMIQLLVNRGACINEQDCDGNTAFHLLFESSQPSNEDLLKYLLEAGADFNIENKNGHTPFACMMSKSITTNQMIFFIAYIALYLFQNLYVNPKIKNYLLASPTWSKHFNLCLKELEEMKKIKILQKYTFYDVLSKRCALLTPVLKEENIGHFEMGLIKSQFRHYRGMIKEMFYKKVERLRCLQTCMSLLNSVFETKLPPEIVEKICNYLSNEEIDELTMSSAKET